MGIGQFLSGSDKVLAYILVACFILVVLTFITKRMPKNNIAQQVHQFLMRYHRLMPHVLVIGGVVHAILAVMSSADLKPGHVIVGTILLGVCLKTVMESERQMGKTKARLPMHSPDSSSGAPPKRKKLDRKTWLGRHRLFAAAAMAALVIHTLTART